MYFFFHSGKMEKSDTIERKLFDRGKSGEKKHCNKYKEKKNIDFITEDKQIFD